MSKSKRSAPQHSEKRRLHTRKKGKNKKDVVVNRPPIIYHPPPEVYHRPDIVVHRAPIMIHRPPIVYHQPPVVVHRPAVVYHQPPIVFHQPAPAVSQPLLYSHDSFVMHPAAVATHMGSIVNDGGHYIGVPHGTINNYPEPLPHPRFAGVLTPPNLTAGFAGKRNKVAKPEKNEDQEQEDASGDGEDSGEVDINDFQDISGDAETSGQNEKPGESGKKDKTAKKNKIIIQRPPMIYHPPSEVYDRPDIIVHRPDLVYHQPSIVYHQPSVVVHRPPIIYRQPPVVFHQPPPLTKQPIIHAHDMYTAQPMFTPHHSDVHHTMTYLGAPHMYPGGWGWGAGWHGNGPVGWQGNGFPGGYGVTQGRSTVERIPENDSRKQGRSRSNQHRTSKKSGTRSKRSVGRKVRHKRHHQKHHHHHRHHHHHHNYHHHHHHHHGLLDKRQHYSMYPGHMYHWGHRKNMVVIRRPPLVYYRSPEIRPRPDIVFHRPDLVYHRPTLMFQQPPTIVHHAPIYYHSPPVVFHDPPPMADTPVVRSHDVIVPHVNHVLVPHSTFVQPLGAFTGVPYTAQYHGSYGHNGPYMPLVSRSRLSKSPDNLEPYEANNSGEDYAVEKSTVARADSELEGKDANKTDASTDEVISGSGEPDVESRFHLKKSKSKTSKASKKQEVFVQSPPIVFHPQPEIFRNPPVLVHQPPVVVHRPPMFVHQPPLVIHKLPIIYHQPPLVMPALHLPVYHATPGYMFPGVHFGKSKVPKSKKSSNRRKKHKVQRGDKRSKIDLKTKHTKTVSGKKKNKVVMYRPPMIYHPPPEVYHRPAIIVHRPDFVIHRPSIVYHQPSVVIHRPPIIYRQPPVVFHQPPPMVHQPIMHAHDTYLAHPVPVPYASNLQHTATYVGAPHYYPGGWNYGYGQGYAFGKSSVERANDTTKSKGNYDEKERVSSATNDTKTEKNENKTISVNHHSKRDVSSQDIENLPKRKHEKTENGNRKNKIMVQRPPMIYHPPPEIYDKPDVIVHRPDLVIHRPSIVYHQPSVVVHRPPIIYRQPPIVFHQPPPMTQQPIVQARDTYLAHPVPVPYNSLLQHVATYSGAPHYYPGSWGYGFGYGHGSGPAVGKSQVPRHQKSKLSSPHRKSVGNKKKIERRAAKNKQTSKARTKKGARKNTIVVQRPAMVYHPPPEVYHRPAVVVHRPDIVIHRPSIVYYQPSVVVHRPPIVYHQPPVVFHQPPPMVNQPIIHAHDTYLAHPVPVPYTSHVQHTATYVGAPHYYRGGWGYGLGYGQAFVKSTVAKKHRKTNHKGKNEVLKNSENKVKRATLHDKEHTNKTSSKDKQNGSRKNIIIMRRPPVIYHPPPEVYHRPSVVLHRPDIVIHRPSVVFDQSPVVVHRPPVIYHQPPIVFHQPPPMVHQPIFHSHETYMAHPMFTPWASHLSHGSTYVGAPHMFPGGWGWGWGHGHAFGKSKIVSERSKKQKKDGKNVTEGVKHHRTRRGLEEKQTHKDIRKLINHFHNRLHDKGASTKKEKKNDNKAENKSKKSEKGAKKNQVIIQRPPVIYHPPPEIYDKPNVIVHRPDIVIHRPSIVYHQPSVVVHRPPIIYRAPPVVFHQPPPMVKQPIVHAHDTYLAHPDFVPYTSQIQHTSTYLGAPHYYPGGWGFGGSYGSPYTDGYGGYYGSGFHGNNFDWRGWGPEYSFGDNVPFGPYGAYSNFGSAAVNPFGAYGPMSYGPAYSKSNVERNNKDEQDSLNHNGKKYKGSKAEGRGKMSKLKDDKDKSSIKHRDRRHLKEESKPRKVTKLSEKLKDTEKKPRKGQRKNIVVMRRPPLIYHPPPEVYHRPSIVMHRPDIVIHRPSVVYHQPAVVVHRPPIIYHQPPVVFHQPPPMVHQPIFHSHEHYLAHPMFVPYTSHLHHAATYVGAPHFYPGGWGWGHGHAWGKSNVQKHKKSKDTKKRSHKKDEIGHKEKKSETSRVLHPQIEREENPTRKNSIVVSRPPIIYHPPPEIYHRPDIVVHRAPIVLHRPPIIYHQPPVIVHRPAVVYHQPPIIFHQPPPTVHQPVLQSHDTFVYHPAARYEAHGSVVGHTTNYIGVPSNIHEFGFDGLHGLHGVHGLHYRSEITKAKNHTDGSQPQTDTKSTISKPAIELTDTHSFDGAKSTAITDDNSQKKTLRSKITKRQVSLLGSHSLFESVSPLNVQHSTRETIEVPEKLSSVPGGRPEDERAKVTRREVPQDKVAEVNRRDGGRARTKRQLGYPPLNQYTAGLPTGYNAFSAAAAMQNPATSNDGAIHLNEDLHPGITGGAYTPDVAALAREGVASVGPQALPFVGRPPLSLPYLNGLLPSSPPLLPKEEAPDVNVHVVTTRSNIPSNRRQRRKKRQIPLLYQPQTIRPPLRELYNPFAVAQLPAVRPIAPLAAVHSIFPVSAYHLPYTGLYHPELQHILSPYTYSPFADQHRPHVNINVQSARSNVPKHVGKDTENSVNKRSEDSNLKNAEEKPRTRNKRQTIGFNPVANPLLLNAFLQKYLPIPSPALQRGFYQYNSLYSYYNPLLYRQQALYSPFYGELPPNEYEEDKDMRMGHLWHDYLDTLTAAYLGHPYHHPRPHVHVDVQTSKSKIPKAPKRRSREKSRISKRQLYNYLPVSPLTNGRFAMPYENPLLSQSSVGSTGYPGQPHVNINVVTAKRNEIPKTNKNKRAYKENKRARKLKKQAYEEQKGQKRDDFTENPRFAQVAQPQLQMVSPFAESNENFARLQQPPTPYSVTQNQAQFLNQAEAQNQDQGQPEDQHFQDQLQEQTQLPLVPQEVPLVVPEQTLSASQPSPLLVPVSGPTSQDISPHLSTLPGEQFVHSPPHVSVNVQTAKKSSLNGNKKKGVPGNHKRQSISVLHRLPVMQVLPQKFLQNGAVVPEFNTVPINRRIKPNGMLISELQKRKHVIPTTHEDNKHTKILKNKNIADTDNANAKRQISGMTEMPQGAQVLQGAMLQPLMSTQTVKEPHISDHPRVSVSVQTSKRNINSLKTKVRRFLHHSKKKEKGETRKKQFLATAPTLSQEPLATAPMAPNYQMIRESAPYPESLSAAGDALYHGTDIHLTHRPHVSVHVEVAKRKSSLKNKNLSEAKKKQFVVMTPQVASPPQPQTQDVPVQFNFAPKEPIHVDGFMAHRPRVSVNVEVAKRKSTIKNTELTKLHKKQFVAAPELGFLKPQEAVAAQTLQPDIPVVANGFGITQVPNQAEEPSAPVVLGNSQLPFDNVHEGAVPHLLLSNSPAEAVLDHQMHRPTVSVKVDIAKRKSKVSRFALNKRNKVNPKRQFIASMPGFYQGTEQVQQPYAVNQLEEQQQQQQQTEQSSQSPVEVSPETNQVQQDQPQDQIQQPLTLPQERPVQLVQPGQPVLQPEQQLVQPYAQSEPQPFDSPLMHTQNPFGHTSVNVNVQTTKSKISSPKRKLLIRRLKEKNNSNKRNKRQLFGTVPLLNPLSHIVPKRQFLDKTIRSEVPRMPMDNKLTIKRHTLIADPDYYTFAQASRVKEVETQGKRLKRDKEKSSQSGTHGSNAQMDSLAKRQLYKYVEQGTGTYRPISFGTNNQAENSAELQQEQAQGMQPQQERETLPNEFQQQDLSAGQQALLAQQQQQAAELERPQMDTETREQMPVALTMAGQTQPQVTPFQQLQGNYIQQVPQMVVPPISSTLQQPQAAFTPYSRALNPRVNVNIQTAKSKVPVADSKLPYHNSRTPNQQMVGIVPLGTSLSSQPIYPAGYRSRQKHKASVGKQAILKTVDSSSEEQQKKQVSSRTKRQLGELLKGILERRGKPKLVGAPINKRPGNRFMFASDTNKPVQILSTDPVEIGAQANRPRIGGIRLGNAGGGLVPEQNRNNFQTFDDSLAPQIVNPTLNEGSLPQNIAASAVPQETAEQLPRGVQLMQGQDIVQHPPIADVQGPIPNLNAVPQLQPSIQRANFLPTLQTNPEVLPNRNLVEPVPGPVPIRQFVQPNIGQPLPFAPNSPPRLLPLLPPPQLRQLPVIPYPQLRPLPIEPPQQLRPFPVMPFPQLRPPPQQRPLPVMPFPQLRPLPIEPPPQPPPEVPLIRLPLPPAPPFFNPFLPQQNPFQVPSPVPLESPLAEDNPDEERPSVHVTVKTSKSRIPKARSSSNRDVNKDERKRRT